MTYAYETEKVALFTEKGQRQFLRVRDHVHAILAKGGAITMGRAVACESGDSWTIMACVDRLVELGEIREIPQDRCAGQDRVFVPERSAP